MDTSSSFSPLYSLPSSFSSASFWSGPNWAVDIMTSFFMWRNWSLFYTSSASATSRVSSRYSSTTTEELSNNILQYIKPLEISPQPSPHQANIMCGTLSLYAFYLDQQIRIQLLKSQYSPSHQWHVWLIDHTELPHYSLGVITDGPQLWFCNKG